MSTTMISLRLAIVLLLLMKYCICYQYKEIGPLNISRAVGQRNIFIPCPFPGNQTPLWNINGVNFGVSSLPEWIKPASYGILLTRIEESMNGTTFQCASITPPNYVPHKSSIGILTVGDIQQEYTNDQDHIVLLPSTPTFDLDHQQLVFQNRIKTIAWNSINNVSNCNHYNMSSRSCSGTAIHLWDFIQETKINISSDDLVATNLNEPAYFNLDAISINGHVCQEIPHEFVVNETDITEEKIVSFNGYCEVISSSAIPNVVLPNINRVSGRDCICPIIINQPCYDFASCSCINETIFLGSISVCKLEKESPVAYHLCFTNLTNTMNNTIIHIFESYRSCNRYQLKLYRIYRKSFKIIIGLPNAPDIDIDYRTGEILFQSLNNHNVGVAYYRIIINDVTSYVFYDEYVQINHTNITGIFQGSTCLPYNVTVQAHNLFGFTEFSSIASSQNQPNDACLCIKQNVVLELNITVYQENKGISLQFECNQTRYTGTDVVLMVNTEQNRDSIEHTVSCENDNATLLNFDSIKCDQFFTISVHWIPQNPEILAGDECIISHVGQEFKCQATVTGDLKFCIIFSSVIIGTLTIIFTVLMILFLYCCRYKCRKYSVSIN